MAQSKSTKKLFNMAYGIGAAIVILGALFKIQHLSIGPLTGGVMLMVGMGVEAVVFAISAFEPVEDDLDWTKVYPELGEADFGEEEAGSPHGMLSKKLDKMLKEANLDVEVMSKLGSSIQDFHTAAEGLNVAAASISTTQKYNEQVEKAASQMESLNGLYQVQMDNANKQAELNNNMIENSQRLKDQMESLAQNLSSLNGVYGGMLSAMSNK